MGGCVAFNCPNRTRHGLAFKAFPRDPKRRALWASYVNRKNWVPTNSSRLCEMHFAPSMWEVDREDGTRKLKINAFPTVFFNRSSIRNLQLPVVTKSSVAQQRLVHYEPSMWEVDESGNRKLKTDAVPSLTFIKRIRLLPTVSPNKISSDHDVMTVDNKETSVLSGVEILVLDPVATRNAVERDIAGIKLETYANEGKTRSTSEDDMVKNLCVSEEMSKTEEKTHTKT